MHTTSSENTQSLFSTNPHPEGILRPSPDTDDEDIRIIYPDMWEKAPSEYLVTCVELEPAHRR